MGNYYSVCMLHNGYTDKDGEYHKACKETMYIEVDDLRAGLELFVKDYRECRGDSARLLNVRAHVMPGFMDYRTNKKES